MTHVIMVKFELEEICFRYFPTFSFVQTSNLDAFLLAFLSTFNCSD